MNKKNKYLINTLTLIISFLFVLPIIILMLWSISGQWSWPELMPQKYSLRAFKYILSFEGGFLGTVLYSIFLSLIVTIASIILSLPAAKALAVYDFKGKKLIEMLILTPLIVPTITVTTGIHVFFIKLGLSNTFLGVVLIHLFPCLPYGIRILRNVYEIIGNKYELQSRVLGASRLKTLFHVTLPVLTPGILSASTLIFVVSFSQYISTLIIGGGSIITLSIIMFPFIQGGDRTMTAAFSMIFILTTFGFLLILEKTIKSYYKIEEHLYV